MKIDIFAHICPQKFIDACAKTKIGWDKFSKDAQILTGPVLSDINKRLEIMSRYEDYVQVLVPVAEVVESFFSPKDSAYLAQAFNDALAEIVNKHPDKFVAAVATLPMNNVDAAVKEIDRAINDLGFKGVYLHTPLFVYQEGRPVELGLNYETIKPIDSPEFMPIYESMSKHNLPIWIHPFGQGAVPVYSGEPRGKYGLHHIFGWPIESAMAMSRLICGGILAKYPNLKFIIHHCGSMIVPALASRIDEEFESYGIGGAYNWDEKGVFKTKRAIDYYKMFYGDTALYGGEDQLELGYKFFGPEHVLFGTDYPFDRVGGDRFIKKTIDAIYKMNISDADKQLIFEGNARRILHLDIK